MDTLSRCFSAKKNRTAAVKTLCYLTTGAGVPGTHFCYRVSRNQGHIAAGKIKSLKNPDRTRNLPVA